MGLLRREAGWRLKPRLRAAIEGTVAATKSAYADSLAADRFAECKRTLAIRARRLHCTAALLGGRSAPKDHRRVAITQGADPPARTLAVRKLAPTTCKSGALLYLFAQATALNRPASKSQPMLGGAIFFPLSHPPPQPAAPHARARCPRPRRQRRSPCPQWPSPVPASSHRLADQWGLAAYATQSAPSLMPPRDGSHAGHCPDAD